MNIMHKALQTKPLVQCSPLPGYEYGRGYGVMILPFESGDMLAMREFPENNFAPYRSIWHRTPDKKWFMYVDGPRHDTACPRYYGNAVSYVQSAKISLTWNSNNRLHIEMDHPKLDWEVVIGTSLLVNIMNKISINLPENIWRIPVALRAFEKIGSLLFDVGKIDLSGQFPNGHFGILMPRLMFLISSSIARLNGSNLGKPIRSNENPMIGKIRLPARPIFAIGRYYFKIQDHAAYEQTVAEMQQLNFTNLNPIES
jgi:hypothetical protein